MQTTDIWVCFKKIRFFIHTATQLGTVSSSRVLSSSLRTSLFRRRYLWWSTAVVIPLLTGVTTSGWMYTVLSPVLGCTALTYCQLSPRSMEINRVPVIWDFEIGLLHYLLVGVVRWRPFAWRCRLCTYTSRSPGKFTLLILPLLFDAYDLLSFFLHECCHWSDKMLVIQSGVGHPRHLSG